MNIRTVAASAILAAITITPTLAIAWELSAEDSIVSFGSIKNDYAGEAHTFSGLSGSVSDEGAINVTIDLTTLNTNIDIRNERMGEFVFNGAATAEITAQVDIDEIKNLSAGQSMTTEVDATMMLLGNPVDVYIDAYVLRVSPDQIMVSTNTASYLSTEDMGVDAGIDMLQELASLDSITRVTPITMRLMFER